MNPFHLSHGHLVTAIVLLGFLKMFCFTGLVNLGRSVNTLSGWQGVTSGGTASINLPVNQRYHGINIQCQGIFYTAPTLTLIGAGTVNATFTFTIGAAGSPTPGSITAIVAGGTNTGMTNGTYTSTLTGGKQAIISDFTGFGATCTVTIAGGIITGIVVNNGGTACALDPRIVLNGSFYQVVNGQVVRNASVTSIIATLNHSGYIPQYGSLPLIYTDPSRNFLRDAEMNSWDLTGQESFQIQGTINAAVGSPALFGVYEFDKFQNQRTVTAQNQAYILDANGKPYPIGSKVPFLAPIGQKQLTQTLTTGPTDITTLLTTYPFTRIYVVGATPGNIYGLDILMDGAIILQTTTKDLYELNSRYNFQTGSVLTAPNTSGKGFGGVTSGTPAPTWAAIATPTTTPNGVLGANSGTATAGAAVQSYPWDVVAIFDIDGRPWKALRGKNLIVRPYSNINQNCTVMVETLPGAFLGS